MFIKNLPKYLFWFTIIVFIVFVGTIFIPSETFCKMPQWFGIFRDFSMPGQLILLVILAIAIVLLILSIFSHSRNKSLLLITIILGVMGIFFLWGSRVPYRCPDDQRIADLRQLRTAENIFFRENQQYADYDQLIEKKIFSVSPSVDPETGERYLLVLSSDKQNFEIKAKLDKGEWYVCNKDECR